MVQLKFRDSTSGIIRHEYNLGFSHIVEQAASARYNRSRRLSTSKMLVIVTVNGGLVLSLTYKQGSEGELSFGTGY